MIEIHSCPSTLSDEFDTYSPTALKKLFGGMRVSPLLDFGIDGFRRNGEILRAVNRISVSDAQKKSGPYEKTGHPCIADFESFGKNIGLNDRRIAAVLNPFTSLPEALQHLIANSYLNEKMKRSYLRVVKTRTERFVRSAD